ncbi:hypothetical protein F8M41_016671 [Gigaspora margarita]|uniref:Uncharacterized protein n=1 Tax=Gigaspora margarita TaxID=4874 RepID=A0A8H3ZZS4_GIGMA|nr:hypothetical protein F8M41_016671 [Gigaspora margarita]
MGKNDNNIDKIKGFKAKEYDEIGKIIWNIVLFMIMLGIIMGPNVDSYTGLNCSQELGIINHNLIRKINYDRCIINGKGFERNHKLKRGNVDFEDEVHEGLAHITVNTNTPCNWFV